MGGLFLFSPLLGFFGPSLPAPLASRYAPCMMPRGISLLWWTSPIILLRHRGLAGHKQQHHQSWQSPGSLWLWCWALLLTYSKLVSASYHPHEWSEQPQLFSWPLSLASPLPTGYKFSPCGIASGHAEQHQAVYPLASFPPPGAACLISASMELTRTYIQRKTLTPAMGGSKQPMTTPQDLHLFQVPSPYFLI